MRGRDGVWSERGHTRVGERATDNLPSRLQSDEWKASDCAQHYFSIALPTAASGPFPGGQAQRLEVGRTHGHQKPMRREIISEMSAV